MPIPVQSSHLVPYLVRKFSHPDSQKHGKVEYWVTETMQPHAGSRYRGEESYKDDLLRACIEWLRLNGLLIRSLVVLLHCRSLNDVDELQLITFKKEQMRRPYKHHNKWWQNMLKDGITFKEAPPTKNPSTSGWPANSLQFFPLTEPTINVHLGKTELLT